MQREAVAMAEIKHIVTDFQKEKLKIRKTIQSLNSEKQNLEEMHRILAKELSETNLEISEKTIYLADQLKRDIGDSERRIERAGRETTDRIEEKTNELSEFIGKSRKMIRNLRDDLEAFQLDLNDNLDRKFKEIFQNNTDFQKALVKKLSLKIAEETNKMQKTFEKNATAKVDDFLSSQTILVDNLTRKFDTFDQRIQELRTELNKVREEQGRKQTRIRDAIKRLTRDRKEQKSAALELRDRVTTLENRLLAHVDSLEKKIEEVRPKGFFSFLRRKPKPQPSVHKQEETATSGPTPDPEAAENA